MKNKAELTTQQIVGLIILIVSFTIILILIFRLNLGETTDKEICHNSVMMKAKSVLKSGPLDCKTTYVCISGGGKCEQFSPTTTIEIDMNQEPEKIKNDTMKAIADEMVDCWWMFGEGEVDYVGLNVKGAAIGKMNCALCSKIKFSKDLNEVNIESENFKKFLTETKKSKGVSYFYYLYKTNNVDDFKIEDINLKEEYYVLTGIAEKGTLLSIKDFFLGSIDDYNKLFFSFLPLPKLTKYENYGPIPVIFKKKSELDKLNCDEFITKA